MISGVEAMAVGEGFSFIPSFFLEWEWMRSCCSSSDYSDLKHFYAYSFEMGRIDLHPTIVTQLSLLLMIILS